MSQPTVPKATSAALGLVTAAALLLELTLTRVLSVALWYPFAYLALGVAMLGFGGAAAWLAVSERLRRRPGLLVGAALAFAAAALLGYPLWNAIPTAPMSLQHDPWQLVWIPLQVGALAVPFICVGLFVARLFADHPGHAARLYAIDLAGAAAGVVLYVVLLPAVGGPGMMAVAAALGIAAALLVEPGSIHRRAALAILVAVVAGGAPWVERVVPLRITPNKLLGGPAARGKPRNLRWTVASTIDVIRAEDGALLLIDGGTAMSLAPRGRGRAGPEPPAAPTGLRALPYRLGPGDSTLIIGSGGGVEVRAALGAGSRRIVALEVDRAVNELVTGVLGPMLGGIFAYPEVELHTAEARSFLAALPPEQRFDAIVAFHTISNAASAGGMSLAESYLLTVEALELLVGRLSDDGVLVMSRPEQQMGRLAATLAAAVHDPTLPHHVAVVGPATGPPDFLSTLVYRRVPFDQQAIEALQDDEIRRVLYAPGAGDLHDYFAAILSGRPDGALHQALPYAAASLEPVTDDRPFFNLLQPWRAIGIEHFAAIFASGEQARMRLEDLPIAQVSVLLLLAALTLFAAAASLPTLRGLGRAGIPPREATLVGLPFACYGLAYIVIEVVLIQRVTRIVGEPGWSIVTVLGVMLLASGAGSALLAGRAGWPASRACVAAAAASVAVAFGVGPLVDVAASWPFAARVVVGALVVAPVGVLLGVPFAATLRRLERDALVAWAWALNSVLSVAGSVLALILSSAWGFTVAAAGAAGIYLIAFATLRAREVRRAVRAGAAVG